MNMKMTGDTLLSLHFWSNVLVPDLMLLYCFRCHHQFWHCSMSSSCVPSEDNIQMGRMNILISGATDGSIAFWDLTKSIQAFMQLVSVLDVGKFIDCPKRPQTGRGSQGGRQWRSLGGSMSKNRLGTGSTTIKAGEETNCNLPNHIMDAMSSMQNVHENRTVYSQAIDTASEVNAYDSSSDICEISPLAVFENIHQSGVNSLHVSGVEGCRSPEIGFLYNLISVGDDQALSCLTFEFSVSGSASNSEFENMALIVRNSVTELGSWKYKKLFTLVKTRTFGSDS